MRESVAMAADNEKPMPGAEASREDILRVNDLLIGLDDAAFEAFVERCAFHSVAQGEQLIREGEVQHNVVFVLDGLVRIVGIAPGGMELNYQDVEVGGWFGEIAAIDKGARSASAYAYTDSEIATVPREVFLNLILEHRHIAVKILERLSRIVRIGNERVVTVSSFSGVQRVYMTILDLAEPDPNAGVDSIWFIPKMPNHEELALKAMTSKEMVARAISQLLQMGVARREKGILRIINREALKQLATRE